ncbi:MAG: signal peptidase I [Myxococcales bacterium 68-20]|nr:MAG: signal peptidase I [Myxococcales bacterium 68-20]
MTFMDTVGARSERVAGEDVQSKRTRSLGALLALVGALAVLAVVAGVVLLLSHARYKQPSASMWPTFEMGSTFTASRLDRTPVRGSVIVFEYPERPEQLFDKRVVAMPGDTLEIRGDAVIVNGWEVPKCRVGTASYADAIDDTTRTGDLFVEWLADASYLVFYDRQALLSDRQGPYKAKEGEYWVLGDNRANSHDSRMWWDGQGGGVPAKNVVARARTPDVPTLPLGSESLQGALDACLAKKPSETRPPAP